jgi:hypothetical protein
MRFGEKKMGEKKRFSVLFGTFRDFRAFFAISGHFSKSTSRVSACKQNPFVPL